MQGFPPAKSESVQLTRFLQVRADSNMILLACLPAGTGF